MKVKGYIFPAHTIEAQPIVLNCYTRWGLVLNFMPRLVYTLERTVHWVGGRVVSRAVLDILENDVGKHFALTGIPTPDHLARSLVAIPPTLLRFSATV